MILNKYGKNHGDMFLFIIVVAVIFQRLARRYELRATRKTEQKEN